jgi:hypothetical protein
MSKTGDPKVCKAKPRVLKDYMVEVNFYEERAEKVYVTKVHYCVIFFPPRIPFVRTEFQEFQTIA